MSIRYDTLHTGSSTIYFSPWTTNATGNYAAITVSSHVNEIAPRTVAWSSTVAHDKIGHIRGPTYLRLLLPVVPLVLALTRLISLPMVDGRQTLELLEH